jgi:hypothetical protein
MSSCVKTYAIVIWNFIGLASLGYIGLGQPCSGHPLLPLYVVLCIISAVFGTIIWYIVLGEERDYNLASYILLGNTIFQVGLNIFGLFISIPLLLNLSELETNQCSPQVVFVVFATSITILVILLLNAIAMFRNEKKYFEDNTSASETTTPAIKENASSGNNNYIVAAQENQVQSV